jgi:hypothetical protein
LREFYGSDYSLEQWDELERRKAFLRFIYIQFGELSIAFRPKTSGGVSYHPDLSFGRVWAHLEASFIRAKIVGFGSFRRVQLNWRI